MKDHEFPEPPPVQRPQRAASKVPPSTVSREREVAALQALAEQAIENRDEETQVWIAENEFTDSRTLTTLSASTFWRVHERIVKHPNAGSVLVDHILFGRIRHPAVRLDERWTYVEEKAAKSTKLSRAGRRSILSPTVSCDGRDFPKPANAWKAREKLAARRDLEPADVEVLALDARWAVRVHVLRFQKVAPDLIIEMCAADEPAVIEEAILRKDCPDELLQAHWNHPRSVIRERIAAKLCREPKRLPDVLRALRRDEDPVVRLAASDRNFPGTPLKTGKFARGFDHRRFERPLSREI